MEGIVLQTQGQYVQSGSYYDGVSFLRGVSLQTPTLSCLDVQNSVTDWVTSNSGQYYPVDCDFSTLVETGAIFMQDPNTFQTYAAEVRTQTLQNDPIPYDSFREVQTGEIVIFLCLLGYASFKSILGEI